MSYYDSALVIAHALHRMLHEDGARLDVPAANCRQIPARPWGQGPLLMDRLKQVSGRGWAPVGDQSIQEGQRASKLPQIPHHALLYLQPISVSLIGFHVKRGSSKAQPFEIFEAPCLRHLL